MNKLLLGFVAVALLSPVATAQTSTDPARASVANIVDLWVTKIEVLTVPAADALPEASYAFVPTAGEFAGVRTFGDQVKHLAAANYQLAARALHIEPPAGTHDEIAPASVRTKAEIITYLKESFVWLHRAAKGLTLQNIEDRIVLGRETESPLGVMIDAIAHSQNHYGQLVEYLRMNHVVPPASR
ncbi:MAG TPA: DinB family protein [Vicinamibacterales bacterium]|nr:DinB family protein [Vicinamibacterales bacterium]